MSASNAFRSHLMQQFAAAARKQTRTPIALVGWVKQNSSNSEEEASTHHTQTSSRHLSAIGPSQTPSVRSYLPSSRGSSDLDTPPTSKKATSRLMSTTTVSENAHKDESKIPGPATGPNKDSSQRTTPLFSQDQGAAYVQSVVRTRRTSSKFLRPSDTTTQDGVTLLTALQYRAAIDRAVVVGRTAPNHKRTEPFTFKRLIGPSATTERLADIAAEVHLRQQHSKFKGGASLNAVTTAANSKREKWSQIPAFLVTLVSSGKKAPVGEASPNKDPTSNYDDDELYAPLPYQPPETERELEDYASACAATQNVLLSLHAEHVSTKWATGTVIRTPAFRKLVQAQESDRVVALVMIGQQAQSNKLYQRRYRRDLVGDVLVDL